MKTFATVLVSTLFLALPAVAEDAPAASVTPAPATDVSKDYVMLKVGGEDIKRSEVLEMWKSIFPGGNPPPFDTFDEKIRDNVLRGIASEHIILKEADKSGIQDTDEVKERIANTGRQIIIQEFLKQKTKDLVSDEKLKEVYDDRIKNAGGQEELHARHILVKTEKEATAIEKQLKEGVPFEKLAKEKSDDKASGASGGDLGWFTADKMVPEFSKAAFALKKGEISQPVKTDFGWHIIQAEDRRKVTPPPYDKVKDALREDMGKKAMGEYVEKLMKNEKITVLDAAGHEKDLPVMTLKPEASAKPDAGK